MSAAPRDAAIVLRQKPRLIEHDVKQDQSPTR
jgi:hypothetical protein